jgi:hypothetical protein
VTLRDHWLQLQPVLHFDDLADLHDPPCRTTGAGELDHGIDRPAELLAHRP